MVIGPELAALIFFFASNHSSSDIKMATAVCYLKNAVPPRTLGISNKEKEFWRFSK